MDYKVSLFQNIRSKSSSTASLMDILNSIKSGQYENLISPIRSNGSKGKELKKGLPAFTVSGYCEGSRQLDNLKEYNSLIQLDYDDVSSPEILKEQLAGLNSTLAAFISPSGRGLKVLVRTESGKEEHTKVFNQIRKCYDDHAKIESDPSVRDILRLCYVSSDSEMYFNIDALPFKTISNAVNSLESLFHEAEINMKFREGNRNNFTFRFSCLARDRGFLMSDVIGFMSLKANYDFSTEEIVSAVNSAYKYPSRTCKVSSNGVSVGQEGKYRQLIDQLSMNFVFMPEAECVFSKTGDIIDYSSIQTYADIRFALKDMKYSISKTDFNDLVKVSSMTKVSPLDLFYSQIQQVKWDRQDHIRCLFDAMNIINPSDMKLYLFEKWLVNAYVFAMRGIDPKLPKKVFSRVALILHSHARGLGKTEFFRKLGLSGHFETLTSLNAAEVYGELSGSFGDDERRATSMMVRNLILNIDDIQEMLIHSSGELRSLISKDTITNRALYSNSTENLTRRAAICGSTNHNEILRNDDENRYLIFSLYGKMNFESLNSINFIQLWRQVAEVFYENGSRSLFKNEDLELIQDFSKEYIYISPEEEVVQEYFEYDPNPVNHLTFREIKYILARVDVRVQDQKLGAALKRLAPDRNIVRKSNGKRYYLVRQINGF